MSKWLKISLLTLTVMAGTFLVYLPHLEDPLPLLGDEYVHISFAEQFLAEGTLLENPYLAPSFPHLNLEPGFHILLSGLTVLFGENTLLYYKYFPALFFVVNALLLFHLLSLWTKQFWPALLGVFFFGTIESSGPILTHHYFIPLTVGVTLLLLLCICFYRWTEQRDNTYLAYLSFFLLAAAVTYPPTFFFFLGIVFVYALSMDHQLHEWLCIRRTAFFLVLCGVTALIGLLGYGILRYLGLLDQIIFYTSWAMQQNRISFVLPFGIIPSAFAALGIYALLRGRSGYHAMPLYWLLYAFVAIYLFYLFEFTILVPFPRLYFFYLIGVSALAGIGVAWILRYLRERHRSAFGRVTGVFLFSLLLLFQYLSVASADPQHAPILTTERYAALTFLREQFPGNGVVITDAVTSFAVPAISDKHVVNLLDANVGGGDPTATRRFLHGVCPEKARALERLEDYFTIDGKSEPLFMLTQRPSDCAFLTLLYDRGVYLYSVSPADASTVDIESYSDAEIKDMLTPPENHALPLRPTLAEAGLRDLLPGNTLEGVDDGWIEYFAPDGSIRGQTPGGRNYTGIWRITRSAYCYYYHDKNIVDCMAISLEDDMIRFYNMDGVMHDEATMLQGNPYDL